MCWQPTPDSIVGIIRMPKEGNLQETIDGIMAVREQTFKADTLDRWQRTIDGYPAIGSGIEPMVTGAKRRRSRRRTSSDAS